MKLVNVYSSGNRGFHTLLYLEIHLSLRSGTPVPDKSPDKSEVELSGRTKPEHHTIISMQRGLIFFQITILQAKK